MLFILIKIFIILVNRRRYYNILNVGRWVKKIINTLCYNVLHRFIYFKGILTGGVGGRTPMDLFYLNM